MKNPSYLGILIEEGFLAALGMTVDRISINLRKHPPTNVQLSDFRTLLFSENC